MSVKRQATTELNHENWDQDDPADKEEMGAFKPAPKEELEKRVIRTAKRRSQNPMSSEGNKGLFSGFGGFNKPKPSSFDFLANLTNGSAASTPTSNKTESSVTSGLFGSKPTENTASGGLFGSKAATSPFQIPTTSSSTPTSNTTFGSSSQKTVGLFGSTTNSPSLPFNSSKADSTVGDKSEPSSTSDKNNGINFKSSSPSTSQVSSSVFGSTFTNSNKTLFSNSTTNVTPFKAQPVSSTTTTPVNVTKTNDTPVAESKPEENPKRMKYYAKLKGLNESVSEWIKKHVGETPLCILTPIFRDYEKYLKEIQEEYEKKDTEETPNVSDTKTEITSTKKPDIPSGNSLGSSTLFSATNSPSSGFGLKSQSTQQSKPEVFGLKTKTTEESKQDSDSTAEKTITSPAKSTGFSFGISSTPKTSTETTSPFSFTPNSTPSTNGAKPFSFGIGQPFSFSPNTQTQAKKESDTQKENENEESDEPPKVEFTPVVEENSVYDKRCKVFVKKDDNFTDKGVGTLYLKKLDSGKHQLIVRANTNLGNVLLNMILSSSLPTQRMGKNNVMIICIPTPDAKPPPVPILIRVKTSEEADELLETLNKYKS